MGKDSSSTKTSNSISQINPSCNQTCIMKTSTIFLSTLVIFVGLLSNALAVKWSSNFAQEDIVTLTPLLKNMQTYLSAELWCCLRYTRKQRHQKARRIWCHDSNLH